MSYDLYICASYIPPANSSSQKRKEMLGIDPFDQLENELKNYKELGKVIIMGDLNARCGIEQDFIKNDSSYLLDVDPFHYKVDCNIPTRYSQDYVMNKYGRQLLTMCKSSQMRILNGRTIGDLHGQFTNYQYNGCSVVDYCIVDNDLLHNINYFKVDPLTHLSDHSLIQTEIKWKGNKFIGEPSSYGNMTVLPLGFKWTDDSKEKFFNAFDHPTISSMVHESKNKIYSIDDAGVNECCEDITNIMKQAGNMVLVYKYRPKKAKVSRFRQHQWYNSNLENLKRTVLFWGKQVQKYPFNTHVKKKYFYHKKHYKKM
jgi:hypothetical protein